MEHLLNSRHLNQNYKPLSIFAPQKTLQSKKLEKKILVSVVVINFNQGHYLPEALNSVYNQTYEEIELIVVDGKSTDNSLDVLGSYSGIKWISEPDNSSGHAFAKGVSLAKGEFIFFLASSDGFFDSDWIKEAVKHFENDRDISLVSADVVGVDEFTKLNNYKWPKGDPVAWSNRELFFSWLFKGIGFTPITFGIRREVLIQCCASENLMGDPRNPDSVDFFWHLMGNFFTLGYMGIKIPRISSFTRFHIDRVDDSEYLKRQQSVLHQLIVKKRRELILGLKPASFLSPESEIVRGEDVPYFALLKQFVLEKCLNLVKRPSKFLRV
jgi:glycosyltransferase involved in cell wall biosynthesis